MFRDIYGWSLVIVPDWWDKKLLVVSHMGTIYLGKHTSKILVYTCVACIVVLYLALCDL